VRQQVLPGNSDSTGSSAKRFIAELEVGERVDSIFLLGRCNLRTRQNGEPYLAIELSDKSGRVSGRQWDNAEETIRRVNEGDFVRVVGVVETWQSQAQIKVDSMAPTEAAGIDPADYLPASQRDVEEMYAELLGAIGRVRNRHLQALLRATFEDAGIAALFRRAPGGVRLHHAYVGGLLEHTLSVIGLAERAAEHYAIVDRDLLVTGACLHDLGKIWELAYEHAFDYTEEGRLVGHIVMEANWLARRMDEIEGFPPRLRHHVLHLLASHHGLHEHGAPVQPATREALVLHYIDDLDSKMGAVANAIAEAETMGADTAYSRSLGRKIMRRRWDDEVDE
jgi:3'-5' exoribonuclease